MAPGARMQTSWRQRLNPTSRISFAFPTTPLRLSFIFVMFLCLAKKLRKPSLPQSQRRKSSMLSWAWNLTRLLAQTDFNLFSSTYWDVIHNDIWQLVQRAFVEGFSKVKLVEILIVLIRKLDHPRQFKDFRPINLCTMHHKLISKVLVHHFRPSLEEIISLLQRSFMPWKGTFDNAIVAQEVVHYMHH